MTIGDERLAAATIVWGAGVAASPAGEVAGRWRRSGRPGRGRTRSHLPGHPEIFVIGDTAARRDDAGKPLPGIAPVAKQQGSLRGARDAAPTLPARRAEARSATATAATSRRSARRAAVADFGWLRLDGCMAWLLWGLVHISS